jgi:hypothetical protein
MSRNLRWLVPPVCLTLGLYALGLSYRAYAKWQQYIALGDQSGAEVYEVEFWPEVTVSVLLIALAAFLAGRWSAAGRRGAGQRGASQ